MGESKKTDGGTWINVNSNNEKGHVNVYGSDPRQKHDSIHVNIDYKNKTFNITEKYGDNKPTKTSRSCYLTTACMKHMKEDFNDNCYELLVLRWFRDNFVSKEDIDHYYETAPVIVDAIDKQGECDAIYETIYQRVIYSCVKAIENDDYEFAYTRYKESILQLEELYARNELVQRLTRVIKGIANWLSFLLDINHLLR